ncbi:unnamed protein product [Linum trigynum]|uniref:Uncharacterized protein n=1 Tax=Linum trigynum TaxID=586398 RepID=A0AAV2GSV5_9ROSI
MTGYELDEELVSSPLRGPYGLGESLKGYQSGRRARYQLDEILKTKYEDQASRVGLIVGADMIGLVARGIKTER